MKSHRGTDTIRFTVKGQVVIPRWLRKEFDIEAGTRAVVQATPEGILLKPVTAASIRRLRGILKRKAGEPSFAEEWARHKADEKTLEDAKYARITRSR
jgi:AbrB family looped-hinge helix DNA binding protein